jgi:hypothetical protein
MIFKLSMNKQITLSTVLISKVTSIPNCLSFEEVTMRTGHEDLIEVDDNILLIFGDQQEILGQPLRPYPIHLVNIVIKLMNCIDYSIILKN